MVIRKIRTYLVSRERQNVLWNILHSKPLRFTDCPWKRHDRSSSVAVFKYKLHHLSVGENYRECVCDTNQDEISPLFGT